MVKTKSFRPWNPEQTLLFPPSKVDWLPEPPREPLVNEGLTLAAENIFGMIGFRGDPAPIHLLLTL
jgi:hypothetical protein